MALSYANLDSNHFKSIIFLIHHARFSLCASLIYNMCNSGPTQTFQTSAAAGPVLPAPNLPSASELPAPSSNQASTHTNSDQCRCQFFWFEEFYVNVIPRLPRQNELQSRPVLNPPYCSVTGALKIRTSVDALGFLSVCLSVYLSV